MLAAVTPESGARRCVELLAVAFSDTIVDVAHLGEGSPPYRIGEGPRARLPVDGEGLPDPASFDLLRAEAGGFWLGLTPCMTGVVLDASGRRSLDALAAEGRIIEAGGARELWLEPEETIWIARGSLRFRVRVVERAEHRDAPVYDWPWITSLISSVCLALVLVVLSHLTPEIAAIDDLERHDTLVRILCPQPPDEDEREELEPLLEERPPPERVATPGLEPRIEVRPARPERPPPSAGAPRSRSSRLFWVPSGPHAVAGHGRNWDPIEAARHAGILGPLGGRPFLVGDGPYDPGRDDGELWASAADLADPTWMPVLPPPRGRRDGGLGVGSTGEGVVGWGSYGEHSMGYLSANIHEDRRYVALCGGVDCSPRSHWRPRPRPSMVTFGQVDVRGALDRDLARRIIRAHVNELRSCFDANVEGGEVELRASVSFAVYQGTVGSVIVDGELPEALRGCMKASFARWHFPKQGGETNLVSVPVRLSR